MRSRNPSTREIPETLPVVPLRDMVVFPHMMAPSSWAVKAPSRSLEMALAGEGKQIVPGDPARSQGRRAAPGRPARARRRRQGRAESPASQRQRQGSWSRESGALASLELTTTRERLMAEVETYDRRLSDRRTAWRSTSPKVLGVFEQYAKLSHHLCLSKDSCRRSRPTTSDRFADQLAAHLTGARGSEKQALLELINPYERLQPICTTCSTSRSRKSTSTSASMCRSRSRWRRRRRSTTSTRRSRRSSRSSGARTKGRRAR